MGCIQIYCIAHIYWLIARYHSCDGQSHSTLVVRSLFGGSRFQPSCFERGCSKKGIGAWLLTVRSRSCTDRKDLCRVEKTSKAERMQKILHVREENAIRGSMVDQYMTREWSWHLTVDGLSAILHGDTAPVLGCGKWFGKPISLKGWQFVMVLISSICSF